MTRIIDGVMLLLSSSLAASILGKATLITTLGLSGAWLARRRRAAVRHAVLTASLAVLLALPIAATLIRPVRITLPASAQDWAPASLFPEPLGDAQPAAPMRGSVDAASARPRWQGPLPSDLLLALWTVGSVSFLPRMIFGLRQVRALRRLGLPWRDGQSVVNRLALDAGVRRRVQVLVHESLPAPVTCGIFRPAIVLPPDAREWEGGDLNRAIVHELEHVRRFDWASQCLARIACAVYWFHPLVWVAWRQLALEAERSCDDAVLARSEATVYADQLVGLAQRLSVAQPPALAMANRSDLSARVSSVLDGSRPRGRAGACLVAIACVVVSAVVLTVSPLRMVAAQASPVSEWQIKAGSAMAFEVASVKPDAGPFRPPNFPLDVGDAYRPVGGHFTADFPLSTYITFAYKLSLTSEQRQSMIAHLPNWVAADRFDIQAQAPDNPTKDQMRLMMQALLAERFKLVIHFETQVVPVLALELAKPGQTGPKLRPHSEGVPCEATSPTNGPQTDTTVFPPVCDVYMMELAQNARIRAGSRNTTLDLLANALPGIGKLERPVVNQTGLSGRYDFSLDFTPESNTPATPNADAPVENAGPTFLEALNEQLGLKLESAKAPLRILLIDHVERPSAN